MSGIVGVVNFDGRPVPMDVFSAMAEQLKARAPDGSDIWTDNHVALAYAHLSFSTGDVLPKQPLTLDRQAWIVADARLDNRDELETALRVDGPDAALILAAYRHYGERFVEYLEGDFAFAIWDKASQKLTCVRDHLGVRPFYYMHLGDAVVFASDIEALKQHPDFGATLDEAFIADFLYFGDTLDADSTVFRHIRRLPAANRMVASRKGMQRSSYWSLGHIARIRYRDEREYRDHFISLFDRSVRNRTRGAKSCILLSGGMDSGAVSAAATDIRAYSLSASGLLPEDDEDGFTKRTANHLRIPLEFQQLDRFRLFSLDAPSAVYPSEPVPTPDLAVVYARQCELERQGVRLVLTGEAGDAVFARSNPAGGMLNIAGDIIEHLRKTGTLRGMRLRALLPRRGGRAWMPEYPAWINPEFEKRTASRDRWVHHWEAVSGANDDRAQIQRLSRGRFFSLYEALRLPFEVKHPFLDLRLMSFLLGIPSHQKLDKGLLRRAMADRMPDDVLNRAKTPLIGDVIHARIARGDLAGARSPQALEALTPYVDCARYFRELDLSRIAASPDSTWTSWFLIHPWALAEWLTRAK